ncbi:dihydrolipoamide acetyltransferase family protein [Kutzneria kofuensis]|uniref:Dihydrolipoamide acetyltransferase component of pyruvate dehydrogenase complex n=1 Tax=Kutzneria kofuensis TaxID=103725 RepID=A0A7W9KHY1_9PSEU|nr:dihydrolipoamide acetyltransferase family protein [Kutzneria kofuensis]MBB5892767.1 pyruvate dehydrogenase E2 component (dihydrolipoamide acetyltransferase) [Kutzneria kofuensis]
MPQFKHFPLPDVGEGLVEAEILTWHVKPGDTVTVNQIIVEIETAKAAVELPCPFAGVVTELLVEPGKTVDVGTPIIVIDTDPNGEAAPTNGAVEPERVPNLVGYGVKAVTAKRRARVGAPAAVPASAAVSAAVEPTTVVPAPVIAPEPEPVAPAGGYVPLAKPPVRKLAKDLGIDLAALAGSGPGGVITREDVEQAATPAAAPVAVASRGERRVPVKGVRKATAQAMVESAFTAPHVTEFLTIDVTPMMELRAKLKDSPEFRGVKLTPLAFAAKAVCLAVRRTPDVNATWDAAANEIVYKDYVHLGIAAATPRGLVVPKVRDADQLSLRGLAEALEQLTATARDGKTTPADMLNGTITITNVGVFGVDTGTPIINPGESAILAFGAIRDMPWVVDGQVVPRKVCQLALSFDHRVVDGQQGSQFLADVGALLADPAVAITY